MNVIKTLKNIIMKKIKIVFVSACVIMMSLASCEKQDNLYSGDDFISFGGTTSATIPEGSIAPYPVTASASVANISSEITVTVSFTGATEGVDYTASKSSYTFGPDQYNDTIEITPIDNTDEDGNKEIMLSLDSSSGDYTLGFPGPDANSSSFNLTIQDDDCAFTIEELGAANWSGQDNSPPTQAGPNASMITTSFDGTNLLLEGIAYGWLTDPAYWEEVVVDSFLVITIVDPITGDITIAEQPLCNTTWLGDAQDSYSIRATGLYAACSETMVIDYDLLQGGGIRRQFSETITINQ